MKMTRHKANPAEQSSHLLDRMLEQIVNLPKLDRTVLLEQLLLMQQGEPEIAVDSLLNYPWLNPIDLAPTGPLH
jgi:hypothetical protein